MKRVLPLLVLLSLARPAPARAEHPITPLLSLPVPQSLTFCGEPVPLQREDVAERLDLELIDTVGSPVRTALWMKRVPRYLPAVEAALRERGLPQDLKYVALIESNLRDDAVSDAGAVGPWQFMPQTGEAYGLEKNGWRESARDWAESTRAALSHLGELRAAFGSWPLALAAYNSGAGRVSRALETQGGADFYDLRLPRETERYVFRAIAAKLVLEDPESYGIRLDRARLYFPEDLGLLDLTVQRSALPLPALAKAAGISYRGLRRMNPWMTGSDLPRGTHRIRVPASRRAGVQAAVQRWEAEHPEPKVVRYRVKRGDTVAGVARAHGVAEGDVRAWNRLAGKARLRAGQTLLLQLPP